MLRLLLDILSEPGIDHLCLIITVQGVPESSKLKALKLRDGRWKIGVK